MTEGGQGMTANFSERMTLALRFEEGAGQVKNGKQARWEGAWERRPNHAGLDRQSKEFKFHSTFSRKPPKGFK